MAYSNLNVERFTNEQALEMLAEYRESGCMATRDQLIMSCMPIVKKRAKWFAVKFDVSADEMIADGIITVIEVIDNADIKGNLYSYVKIAVRHRMWQSDQILNSGVIRIPEKAKYAIPNVLSFETPVGNNDDSANMVLGDFIADDNGEHTDRISIKIDVRDALSKLPEDQQGVIRLNVIQGIPRPKASSLLSITERRLRTLRKHGLNALRELLSEYAI